MKVNFNGNAKGVIIMNLNKGKRLLIWAFVILIVINISMSIIGGLITHNMNTQFNKTFEEKLIDGEKAENIPSYQKANQIYERSRILLIWLSLFVFIITAGIFWAVVKRLGKYETQLYKEKEKLQITLNSIGDGVITTDLSRNILSLNQAAEVYTGWRSEDAVGSPFTQVFQVINVNNGEKAKDPVEEVLSTNDVFSLENHTLLTGKDGIQRHIAHNAAPIKDLEGNTVGVVMVFRDVTERKMLQEQLRLSEEHYRMLFNSMLNGYALHEMIFDDQGVPCDYRFVDVNPAFEEMIGIKKEFCIGKTVKELFPEAESFWITAYGKVVLTGEAIELKNYSKALGKYYQVFAFRPLENHFAVLMADVTERWTMEKTIMEREERFHSLFENMASGVVIYDILNQGASDQDYIIKDYNQTGLDIIGKKKEEVLGKSLREVQPYLMNTGLISVFRKVWQSRQAEYYLAKIHVETDYYQWFENRIFPLTSGEIVAIFDNVTESIELNKKLKEREEQYRLLVEHQSDLIVKTDLTGCYLYISPSYCKLIGKTEGELLGTPFRSYVYEEDIPKSQQAIADMMQPPYTCSFEERIKTVHGLRWIEWEGKAVLNGQGEVISFIDSGRDITERKKYEEEILYLNYHDVLTGLYNRKFFEEETKRLDTERQLPISVIWGDINGLKLINDGFGHSQGDKVLIEMSKILSRCCRNEDIVARIGGDEFCILLPQTTNKDVQEICQRIQMACEEYRQQTEREIFYPSISLGYGTKTIRSESMEGLLKKAEAFMYRSKLLESKSMYSSIISSIKTTMSEKSHETEEHAERLVWLSRSMGKQLNLPEEQLNELTLFATLHDIGKMSVDDRILNKSDKLSDEEWSEMKKHTDAGYRIAVASKELIHIAGFILTHHEHWDGSGYPQGLKGQEIPLLSRILAIIDAYDAMTQDRPYRKAMSKMDALKEIHKHAGSQFDPELVEMFIEMTQKGL